MAFEKLTEITNKAIEERFSASLSEAGSVALVNKNLAALVRENYDLWYFKLFPVLRMQGQSVYAFLVDLLSGAGLSVTAEGLAAAFSAERNRRQGNKGRRSA